MKTIEDVREIQRVPLTHVDDVEAELRGQVLSDAHSNFGYCADSFGAAGPLAKALVSLGIAPLDNEQVEAYMKSKARTETRCFGLWLMVCIDAILTVMCAGGVLFRHLLPPWLQFSGNTWEASGAAVGLLLISAFGALIFAGMMTDFDTVNINWGWREYMLNKGSDKRYPPLHPCLRFELCQPDHQSPSMRSIRGTRATSRRSSHA